MANDGQIVFEVTADGKRAIADVKDITRAIQQESGKWDKAAKESTDNISNNFSGMLKKLVAGFSAVKIGKALLDIGKAAVSAASDLEEVQNVVDVTFGDGASKIEAWAKNAGSQFGLTETQAKRFTSTLGAMMKSAGLTGDEIVDMSTDMAGLAADMASFYNLDFDTAFQKIRSGISGETEPLKQLGINMSVANLNAFALQKGLSKTFEQMTQGEQTMLRYQYLMAATSDAQGDFARTSDGYANSMRTLETNVENLKTKLGEILLPAVTEVVSGLNDMLDKLTPKQERTVLDDFADIDLKTADKLAAIKETSENAHSLAVQLDSIARTKTGKAVSAVQSLADELTAIDLDQEKSSAVGSFLKVLRDNIDVISAIKGTDAKGAEEWISGIADAASKLTPEDAAGWETLLNSIKEGLPGLENTDFGVKFFAALGEGFSDVESKSSVLQWAVDMLGNKTNKTAQEQALWLETCQRLVKTIPGLSSIINTETGEIKGGTEAVKDYIKAWEEGQTKLAMLNALSEKESALASRFSDLPGLQLDKAVAEKRVRDQRKTIDALLEKYGKSGFNKYDETGHIIYNNPGVGLTDAEKEIFAAIEAYNELVDAQNKATKSYQDQADALEEAEIALEEARQTVEEMPGSIEDAGNATEDWLKKIGKDTTQITTIVSEAEDALKSLADYTATVRENVKSAVDSSVSGFDKIERSSVTAANKIDELVRKQASFKIGSDEWKNVQAEIDKQNEQIVTRDKMLINLKSQAAFIDEYLANLEKARSMGLSDELLASLSDGSVESADYLAALVDDMAAGNATAAEIDAKFKEVQQKKEQLADQLTQQQLTVDETYQSLAAKAKEAVDALDLEDEAATNSGKTISGVASGIASHVDEVKTAVDSIIEQLNRLDNFGIDIDFGGFGNISFKTSTGKEQADGAGRFGIYSVPFDGYLARLHKSESVLNAEESAIWRNIRQGGFSTDDLESLGGVINDNTRGGDVYLDGRKVGSVINARQAQAYRQLQRSGWTV